MVVAAFLLLVAPACGPDGWRGPPHEATGAAGRLVRLPRSLLRKGALNGQACKAHRFRTYAAPVVVIPQSASRRADCDRWQGVS